MVGDEVDSGKRMLMYYLGIGGAQGFVLWWGVLKGGLAGPAVFAVTAALVGGLLLQLLGRHAWNAAALAQSLAVTVVLAVLVSVAVNQWDIGFSRVYEGGAGLALLTIASAAWIGERQRCGFGRSCLDGVVIVALALPLPWAAQWASHLWQTLQHTDPFKSDASALLYFVRPMGLFALGVYCARRGRAALLQGWPRTAPR